MVRSVTFILCFLILTALPIMAKTTIVFIGDSLTAGLGVEKEQAYPSLIDKMFKENDNTTVHIINGSISGSTTASAPGRIKWFLKVKPQIIVLALGANDGLRGLSTDDMQKNLSTAIEYSQKAGIKVILVGMEVPPNYGADYTEAFRKTFTTLAEEFQTPFIPFLLKNVGGHPELNQADGIHPNPAGHRIIATTVYPYIKENL